MGPPPQQQQQHPITRSNTLNPCWTQLTEGHVHSWIRKGVVWLGTLSATHPVTTVAIVVFVSLAMLGIGLGTNFEMELNQLHFVTPTNSLPDIHSKWIENQNSNNGGAEANSGFPNTRTYYMNIHNHGSNVLNAQAMEVALEAMTVLQSTKNYQELCQACRDCSEADKELLYDGQSYCRISSVTQFWDHSLETFRAQQVNTTTDSDDHVRRVVSHPTFPDGTPVYHEAILGRYEGYNTTSGQPIDYSNAPPLSLATLMESSATSTSEMYLDSAQCLTMKVDIPDVGSATDDFEHDVLDRLGDLQDKYQRSSSAATTHVQLEYFTMNGYQYEMMRAMITDIPLVGVLIVVMVAFAVLIFSDRHDRVQSRGLVGLYSFSTIGLSMFTGYGIMFCIGIPVTTVAVLIPFVVCGVGLDDTFIITGTYFRLLREGAFETLIVEDDDDDNIDDTTTTTITKQQRQRDTTVRIIQATLDEVAVSITMTTITTLLAFLTGGTSKIPAVRWLCWYAAISLFVVYVYQITAFIALLVLDERRVQANRKDLCFWIVVHDEEEEEEEGTEEETPKDKNSATLLEVYDSASDKPSDLVSEQAKAEDSEEEVSQEAGTKEVDVDSLNPVPAADAEEENPKEKDNNEVEDESSDPLPEQAKATEEDLQVDGTQEAKDETLDPLPEQVKAADTEEMDMQVDGTKEVENEVLDKPSDLLPEETKATDDTEEENPEDEGTKEVADGPSDPLPEQPKATDMEEEDTKEKGTKEVEDESSDPSQVQAKATEEEAPQETGAKEVTDESSDPLPEQAKSTDAAEECLDDTIPKEVEVAAVDQPLDPLPEEAKDADASTSPTTKHPEKSFPERLMGWYADRLLKPVSKAIVLLVFAVYFAGTVYSTTLLRQEFNIADYIPEDSHMTSSMHAWETYSTYLIVNQVYFRNVDQADPLVQLQMMDYVQELSGLEAIGGEPGLFWLRDFRQLAASSQTKELIGIDIESLSFNEQVNLALSIPQLRQIYGRDIVRDPESGNITASRCFMFLRNFDPTHIPDQIDFLMDQRDISLQQPANEESKLPLDGGLSFFSFAQLYFYWELFAQVINELVFNTVLCVAVVSVIAFILVPHWSAVFYACPLLIMLYFNLMGTMQYCGITINVISYFILVTSIGLLVDFLMHILLRYYESKGATRDEKVKVTLETIGASILTGAFTTFLGVIPLAFSTTKVFNMVFICFLAMVVLGCAAGLILLPVLLSLTGPLGDVQDVSTNSDIVEGKEIADRKDEEDNEIEQKVTGEETEWDEEIFV